MIKIFLSIITLLTFTSYVNAQDASSAKKQEHTQLTNEQKAKMAAKKEADLIELFKRADLTDEEQLKSRTIMAEYSAKYKLVKEDGSLSEDEKKVKLKEISNAKNDKLKEIMGEAKYKAFDTAKKAQKAANENAEAAKN